MLFNLFKALAVAVKYKCLNYQPIKKAPEGAFTSFGYKV
jgi:hypothetical protein